MVRQSFQPVGLPKTQEEKIPLFKWTSIPIQEIVEENHRLEASVYGIEGRQARKDLENCKWNKL